MRLWPSTPLFTDSSDAANDHQQSLAEEKGSFRRNAVVEWAIEHGCIRSLEKLDEVNGLNPSINTMAVTSTRTKSINSDESLKLLPLHLASLYGQAGIIDYLLLKGADINVPVAGGFLPIHFAKTGNVVQILYSNGSHLDAPNGITPLIKSLSYQIEPSAVKAFLHHGADLHHITKNGITPAEVAVMKGNIQALEILLEAGADVTRPLPEGGYLIYKAIWFFSKIHGKSSVIDIVQL